MRKEKTGDEDNEWNKLPEKVYLIECGWWDRWCDIHNFAKYAYLVHLHKSSKENSNAAL